MHDAYDELYVYALTRRDPRFVLQHVVDAHAAQTATAGGKPINIVFALIGLYLYVEAGYSGRDIQRVHMRLGRFRTTWPDIALPRGRGHITAADVLVAPPGSPRDDAIGNWCRSVWAAFAGSRDTIVALLKQHRVL